MRRSSPLNHPWMDVDGARTAPAPDLHPPASRWGSTMERAAATPPSPGRHHHAPAPWKTRRNASLRRTGRLHGRRWSSSHLLNHAHSRRSARVEGEEELLRPTLLTTDAMEAITMVSRGAAGVEEDDGSGETVKRG